jgi:hypothetical protein
MVTNRLRDPAAFSFALPPFPLHSLPAHGQLLLLGGREDRTGIGSKPTGKQPDAAFDTISAGQQGYWSGPISDFRQAAFNFP